MSLFHRCRGKPVAVSHYYVKRAAQFEGEEPTLGTYTRVLYRCSECGDAFVNTYPGKWSLEDMQK